MNIKVIKVYEEKLKGCSTYDEIINFIKKYTKKDMINLINVEVFEEKIRELSDPWQVDILINLLKEIGFTKLNDINVKVFLHLTETWLLRNRLYIKYLIEFLKKHKYEKTDILIKRWGKLLIDLNNY